MEEMQDNTVDAVTGERKNPQNTQDIKSIHKRQQIHRDIKSATNITNLIIVRQKEKFAETVIK